MAKQQTAKCVDIQNMCHVALVPTKSDVGFLDACISKLVGPILPSTSEDCA